MKKSCSTHVDYLRQINGGLRLETLGKTFKDVFKKVNLENLKISWKMKASLIRREKTIPKSIEITF